MIKFLIAALILFSAPAAAQNCGPIEKVIGLITGTKYKEAHFLTFNAPDGPVKIYVNFSTKTWTIVAFPVAAPTNACVIIGGKGIEKAELPEQFIGDPA